MLQDHEKDARLAEMGARWAAVDTIYARLLTADALVRCRLCGHEGPQRSYEPLSSDCRFGGGQLIRYRCPVCEVIFGPIKMFDLSEDELKQEYSDVYEIFSEGVTHEFEMETFLSLRPTKGKRYLDMGSGVQSPFLERARGQGYDVIGYDPFCSSDIVVSELSRLEPASFHGIISNNFLEHVTDPVAIFNTMQQLLAPGGAMAHSTPCYEYLYEWTRFHLFFFVGRSLDVLCERTGLRCETVEQRGEYILKHFRAR